MNELKENIVSAAISTLAGFIAGTVAANIAINVMGGGRGDPDLNDFGTVTDQEDDDA